VLADLFKSAGLPAFTLDAAGFPEPGAVIRHYREKMKYEVDGKERSWTQADLARVLGVSEVTIRMMETQNKGLDSIARRRMLADILKIPPVLLGLSSLSDLEHFLSRGGATSGVSSEVVKLYQDALKIYSDTHSVSTVQNSLSEIEVWIERVAADATRAPQLVPTLWGFHNLTAKVYGDDLRDWNHAQSHLNAAIELATQLKNPDYLAATYYRSAQLQFAQRNRYGAKADLTRAVGYAKNASPEVKGAVYSSAGLAYALVPSDLSERKYAQSLIDQAGTYASDEVGADFIIRFDTGKFLLEQAEALIHLGHPDKALDILDQAEETIDRSQTRRVAYIDILRASAYIHMRKPEWDTATELLAGAFAISKSVNSAFNIGCISKLFATVAKSPYGNSPSVANLGKSLSDWRKSTH
jgi:tetratricopeptide (TPR) repeat protein